MLGLFETLLPSTVLSFFGNLDPYRLHESPVYLAGRSSSKKEVSSPDEDKTQTKHYESVMFRRKEGWTEQFGARETSSSSPNSCWDTEEEYTQLILDASAVSLTPNIITLVQHRVAWQEQLILRIIHLAYKVINSNRFYTEATGPLPYLIHPLTSSSEDKKDPVDDTISVVLIGKYDTSPPPLIQNANIPIPTHNAIVDYLLLNHIHNKHSTYIVESMSNHHDQLFIHWVQQYLEPILLLLRYGHSEMWDQVYQKQCIQAFVPTMNSHPQNNSSIWRQWLGRYQAMSERVIALKNLSLNMHSSIGGLGLIEQGRGRLDVTRDLDSILHQARLYYSLLNTLLESSSSCVDTEEKDDDNNSVSLNPATCSSSSCTLGEYYQSLLQHVDRKNTKDPSLKNDEMKTPSFLVVLLFSHLADALCNVHLVPILADFRHLTTLFQNMYTLYFGEDVQSTTTSNDYKDTDTNPPPRNSLHQWNQYMNSINAFQPIPSWILNQSSPGSSKWLPWLSRRQRPHMESYAEAIRIMQRVAIHTTHDLNTILDKVSYEYQREMLLRYGSKTSSKTTTTTVRANVNNSPKKTNESEGDSSESHAQNHQMQRLMKEAQKKDQLWISSVVACTVVGYLIAALKSMQEESH